MLRERPCPVCLGSQYKTKYIVIPEKFFRDNFGMHRACIAKCANCGMLYTNPLPINDILVSNYIDVNSSYNTKLYRGIQDIYWLAQEQCLREVLMHLSSDREKILDVGCGVGGFVHLCQKNGLDAYGIDINSTSIETGKQFGVRNLFKQDVDSISANSFSIISAIHLLEHVVNCHEYVMHFSRILSEKGKVFVMLPNVLSFKQLLLQQKKKYWAAPYEHINGFTGKNLDYLFAQHGFERMKLISKQKDFMGNLTRICWNGLNYFPVSIFAVYRKN